MSDIRQNYLQPTLTRPENHGWIPNVFDRHGMVVSNSNDVSNLAVVDNTVKGKAS